MLAIIPGVTRLDSVTDALGRTGFPLVADSLGMRKQDPDVQVQMIFNRQGDHLGDQSVPLGGDMAHVAPGTIIGYDLVKKSGWTDRKPDPRSAS